jgi:hypothetical protein
MPGGDMKGEKQAVSATTLSHTVETGRNRSICASCVICGCLSLQGPISNEDVVFNSGYRSRGRLLKRHIERLTGAYR